MEQFASGWKRNYYGKGDVIVYRLQRDGRSTEQRSAVFGANVLMLVYGDAFWQTYTTGDNTGLVATDSMKNFIQRETLNFDGFDYEEYCQFLACKFITTYPQVEGVQVSATELPFSEFSGRGAYAPGGPEQATARIELARSGAVEATSGIHGFRLLRLGGSAFTGFVRDEYTTLPELHDRPLHMWLDVEWRYTDQAAAFNAGRAVRQTRTIVTDLFQSFESGSIQQVIHQIGSRMLAEMPTLAEVHLEAQNRTWDTVAETGGERGIYTDPRPPYGCLGLRLTR
jgi:urate oxidase